VGFVDEATAVPVFLTPCAAKSLVDPLINLGSR
jgi:hypothetical protein